MPNKVKFGQIFRFKVSLQKMPILFNFVSDFKSVICFHIYMFSRMTIIIQKIGFKKVTSSHSPVLYYYNTAKIKILL